MSRVQQNMAIACALHFNINRARHNIAGSKRAQRVMLRHELDPAHRSEDRAFASKCLRDQEVLCRRVIEASRVKLHELQVRHSGSGPISHGNPVARRNIGIR